MVPIHKIMCAYIKQVENYLGKRRGLVGGEKGGKCKMGRTQRGRDTLNI